MNPQICLLNKSVTLKITSLTKKLINEGKDVINFAAGEPDFDTPDFVKKEAIKAIEQGYTKYMPSIGLPQLREKIAVKLQTENKLNVSAGNIIVTSGAKYSLFAALFTLLDKGDEVIIPSPYWVSYPEMVKLASAKSVILPTKQENNFKIDPKELKKTITSKTKVLILNYPSNPTGATYSSEELSDILAVIKDKGIYVVSDEIYEVLTYDGRKHVSFGSLPGAKDITITINGFSKAFSMTGWRLGYLSANAKLVAEISKVIDHTTSCACSISQKAGVVALEDKQWQEKIKAEFQSRRDLLFEGLKSFPKLEPIKPEGTFYLFCSIKGTKLNSLEFSTKLLERHLVSCIPAYAFGAEGFVRCSFATSKEQITKGIERIGQFLK